MMEVGMIISLTVMGIYFFKSTDLPKELTDRSTQLRNETVSIQPQKKVLMSYPKAELKQENIIDKSIEINLLNKEIDRLTMEITSLEQEIVANNEQNVEIQLKIDSQLVSLQLLHKRITSLS